MFWFIFQPKLKLTDIAFNAEYLVEVALSSDESWFGKMTFFTPTCSKVKPLDETYCEEEIMNKPRVITKPITTTQPGILETLYLPGNTFSMFLGKNFKSVHAV